ncbi:hypothetical protein MKW94_022104, partial [Papaver nudicaule]|nr:hypothetical protein [Papaver nudicaule]
MSLRQREERKSRVDETPNFKNASPYNVKTGASSQDKVINLTDEYDEEKVAEEAGFESEGDSLDDAVSSEGQNAEEFPSRRRLMSLRQREERKSRDDETPNFENTSPYNVKTGVSSQDKVINLTDESDEENVAEEAGFESVGDSLDDVLSECQSAEEFVTPSRRRLMSLRQREERKSRANEAPTFENTSPYNVKTGASSQENVLNLNDETDEEKVAEEGDSLDGFTEISGSEEEAGFESEGNSLDGFIDNSGSEDISSEVQDAVNSAVAIVRRRREEDNKEKWKSLGGMLSSFQEDPILSLKAVCALYRQQTAEEISAKGSLLLNNRGFGKLHAF